MILQEMKQSDRKISFGKLNGYDILIHVLFSVGKVLV